jgi:hypothetical protein
MHTDQELDCAQCGMGNIPSTARNKTPCHLAHKQSLYGLSYLSTQCNNKYLPYFYTTLHTVKLQYQVNKCHHQSKSTIPHTTPAFFKLKHVCFDHLGLFPVTENNVLVLRSKAPSP